MLHSDVEVEVKMLIFQRGEDLPRTVQCGVLVENHRTHSVFAPVMSYDGCMCEGLLCVVKALQRLLRFDTGPGV